jgi:hypothetical protein
MDNAYKILDGKVKGHTTWNSYYKQEYSIKRELKEDGVKL